MLDLAQLRNLTRGRFGKIDAPCPLCGPHCKTPSNRTRKVLRIWDDGEFVTYKCARCEAHGYAKDGRNSGMGAGRKPEIAEPEKDKSEIARFLWQRSLPAAGTIVETYLASRQCWMISPNIRFLPSREPHAPAMIARMGPNGIHLTRLRADGRGKAGTDKDKIMIGASVGESIIVQDNPERGELILAEGIEDAASMALVTGWSAWAAGAAGRIHHLTAKSGRFDKVFLAVDRDRAGELALLRAREVRPDVIPIQFAKVLAIKEPLDANRALIRFGLDAVLAAVEWSEAQASYRQGRIGFHAMQDALARANAIFTQMAS